MDASWLAILGGLAAGFVHVVSGPDHLAAVLPLAVGRGRRALSAGLAWGMGHGLGVIVLGLIAVLTRQLLPVEQISHGAEVAVGALLIGLGAWTIHRSRLIVVHSHPHDHGAASGHDHDHPHVHLGRETVDGHHAALVHHRHGHGALGFGFVHGLAGAGHLLGALPALALGPGGAVAYLAAFLAGGTLAMAGFAGLAGLLARTERWLPTGLTAAGTASIGVGIAWLVL